MARFREPRESPGRIVERGRREKRREGTSLRALRGREPEEPVLPVETDDEAEEMLDLKKALGPTVERAIVTMAGYSVRYHWIGIYLVDEEGLTLHRFRGDLTPHRRIARGKGVCGAVAESGCTEIVPDVAVDSRYLCCSLAVKSEIVVPIITARGVAGVVDIDSHEANAFGEADKKFLEGVASDLARKIEAIRSAAEERTSTAWGEGEEEDK